MRILVRSTFKKFESMSFEGVEREERRDQAFSNFPEPTYWSHAVSHGNHVSVTMLLLTIYKRPCSCMPLFTRVEPAEEDPPLEQIQDFVVLIWTEQRMLCPVIQQQQHLYFCLQNYFWYSACMYSYICQNIAVDHGST